jgi:hypothetical protein
MSNQCLIAAEPAIDQFGKINRVAQYGKPTSANAFLTQIP